MLSDRERQELADIERQLTATDRRLAAALEPARPPAARRWPLRALLGFGAFLVFVALVTGADGLFLQGLLCLAAGLAWRRWRAVRTRDTSRPGAADRSPGTRPDGAPPGWFRPV